MSRWKEYKLSELCELIGGGTPKTSVAEYWNGDIPWLSVTDFNTGRKYCFDAEKKITEKGLKESSTKILKKGQIIISARGTVGVISMLGNDMAFNQSNYGINAKEGLTTNDFLYYLLKDNISQFVSNSYGAVFDTITKQTFEQITVDLPPLPEQIAIAEILSSLDDKIDLLHRQNKTLEQLAETLFRKWFVGNQKIELRNGKLGELIETTLGGEWGKEIAEGDYTKQVCCIRGTDIADLQTGLAERTPIRFVKERKFESIEPKDGDLILEISGGTDDQSTGRTIYITELNKTLFPYPLVFSNFCRLLRPKKKEYCYFLFLYIQYLYKQDEFFNLENGSSGIKNLDYKYLLFELEYPLPEDKGHILNFNKEIEIYFEKINKNKHQILTLKQLRDALLPKLMNGEVRIDFTDSQLTKPVKSKKANVG